MIPITLLVPLRMHDAIADADADAIADADADADAERLAALCAGTERHVSVLIHGESPPPPLMTADVADGIGSAIWAESVSDAIEALHARAARLGERLVERGVSHDVDVAFQEGRTTERDVGCRARRADATVLLRPASRHDALERHWLSGALFHSARPLLVLPDVPAPTLAFRHVLVAWDGGLAAARALEAALPICREADAVTLASIDDAADDPRPDDGGIERREIEARGVLAWLRRHGVSPTVERRSSGEGDVADALRALDGQVGADLLVSGAYGHSELRERWFGGTTRSLLDDCPVALLLAH